MTVDPSSYIDPNGYVVRHRGRVFRVIREPVTQFYRELATGGVLSDLEHRCGLVHTSCSEEEIPGVSASLVFEHELIEPATHCVEWTPSLLRAAALATMDLALDLHTRGLALQDAYPWNVLFRGVAPVFVDVTSIVPSDPAVLWPAYDQYAAFFLRPLYLAAMRKGDVGRALLRDNIDGITLEQLMRLAPLRFSLRHPVMRLGHSLDQLIQRRRKLRARAATVTSRRRPIDEEVRRRFLTGIRRRTARLSMPQAGDPWLRYYADIPDSVDREMKLDRVRHVLDRIKPSTVLDLGANTGVFSLEAARRGGQVVALDTSESCMEALYHAACSEDLTVTPLVVNVLQPTPAYGFLAEQYPPLLERVRSDLVLCLGLMHHLHIRGRQSFDRISALLTRCSSPWLLFEYVDREDSNNEFLGSRRVIDYTEEHVLGALSEHFQIVERFESDRPTRSLILARTVSR